MVEQYVPLNQVEDFKEFCQREGIEPSREAAKRFLFDKKEKKRDGAEEMFIKITSVVDPVSIDVVELDYEKMRILLVLKDGHKRQVRMKRKALMEAVASLLCRAIIGSRIKGAACET